MLPDEVLVIALTLTHLNIFILEGVIIAMGTYPMVIVTSIAVAIENMAFILIVMEMEGLCFLLWALLWLLETETLRVLRIFDRDLARRRFYFRWEDWKKARPLCVSR